MKYLKQILLFFSLISLLVSCQEDRDAFNSIPFVTLGADQTGISFSNQLTYSTGLNIIEYLYYYNGGGVAVGDINNDGLEDLYFTANQLPDRLYLNKGNLTFEDISVSAGLDMEATWSNGVSMEDVNNDGFLDIYVTKVGLFNKNGSHNMLYLNNGDNSFTEQSEAYGLNFSGFSTQATFFDYDRDGDLDMYLLNHGIHSIRSYGTTEKRSEKDSLSGDRFYENKLNEGKAFFEEVTEAANILSSPLGYGLAITASDINADGWMDLYVGNDFHENDYIYINNKDKTFTESSSTYINHSSRFTMGVDFADMNNDGLFDVFTTDMMPYEADILLKSGGEDTDKVTQIKKDLGFGPQYSRNHFHVKKEYGDYAEIALKTQTFATDWSWSVLLQDFDNDGLNDIFVSNGIAKRPNDLDYINFLSNVNYAAYEKSQDDILKKELIDQMPVLKIPNILFKNKGELQFSEVKESFVGKPSLTNGTAYSDLDNDGDLDLILNNLNAQASILENKTVGDSSNYLSINLKGDSSYSIIKGTQVTLYAGQKKFRKEQQTTKGFQSSSTQKLFFGLGEISKIDSISIRWPDGKTQGLGAYQTNQELVINRNIEAYQKSLLTTTIPDYTISVFSFQHKENIYLDYEREQLMPEKLSKEGPAVVLNDFNGDGIKDIYIGGARYQESKLYIGTKNKTYTERKTIDFIKDINFEDVDAASFDFDNDGDLDLYVVSGGGDFKENENYLMDRIYINDGKANFSRFKIVLAQTNGGTVEVADFDNDGFDDLFIGSRSLPGAYGLSPYSFLLRNNTMFGFEMTLKSRFGLVTDSAWADINNDDLIDLVVVGDWMPITVVLNKGAAKFEIANQSMNMTDTEGMWNTVAIEDIDGDGLLDIIAGNAGTNFKWQASVEKPVFLYLDDFDENEQLDPIIFYNYFGDYVPFSSKNKLSVQLPYLKKKFNSYKKFSGVRNIQDLTDRNENDILEIKKIVETRSMVYLQKDNKFEGHPLPPKAQLSSIQDFYLDQSPATPRLFYVGNYDQYITDLGNSSSNTGGVLSQWNSDKNTFEEDVFLPLPIGINAKRILKLDQETKLIMSNNDYVYLLSKTKTNENK